MADNEVMNPTNDYIFRRIFGREENKEITKGLKCNNRKRHKENRIK